MNETIYEKNMEALQQRFPGMAQMLEEGQYKKKENVSVKVETASDGSSILRVEKDNRSLYLSGKREPKKTAERVIEYWGPLNRATTIFVTGMGNVAFIKEVLERTESDMNFMIYEPSCSVFLTLLKEVDITEYFQNRAIGLVVQGVNEEEMEPVIKAFLNLANVSYMKQYVSPNYEELFPEETVGFLTKIDQVSSDLISGLNTWAYFSTVEADNLFHNLPYLCDGSITTQLCDIIPIDIPAIVVAAGPSLNKNIEILKRAKNRAFIVAVDTAVKPLVNAGIIPDLYVVIDGKKPLKLFELEEARTIPMVTSITAAKDVLKNHTGKKLFFFEGENISYHILAMNGIPFSSVSCGGSVACSAFSLVYKLGFSTIIMVGQDLALTGNRSHADGTFQEKMEEIDTSNCIMVEGNNGEKIPTLGNLKMYLDWFNYYIAGCEDVHVINATEGGAKIENTEVMTLKDALERECKKEVDIEKCFEKLAPVLNQEARERAVEYLHTIPDQFQKLYKEVEKEERHYKKLKNICSAGRVDQTAYLHVLNKIKKETEKIETHELFNLITLTLPVLDYTIMREQFQEEESLEKEGQEIARQGFVYIKNVKKCIKLLQPLAEKTIGKIS